MLHFFLLSGFTINLISFLPKGLTSDWLDTTRVTVVFSWSLVRSPPIDFSPFSQLFTVVPLSSCNISSCPLTKRMAKTWLGLPSASWGYKIELFFKFNHWYKLFIFRFTPKIKYFSLIIGMPANSKMVRLSTVRVGSFPMQDRACCLTHNLLTMLSWPDDLFTGLAGFVIKT